MGKQLLFDALQGQKTLRAPWLPFVGCHGAKLIQRDIDAYLKSGHLIVEGIREAITQYRPDGISVMFDLQIEAEALGCELQWTNDSPPSVIGHVLDSTPLQSLVLPDASSGRIPEILAAIRQLKADQHDVALYGLITGPFTLALHLKGTNIFMEMFDRPGEVKELLQFCTEVSKTMAYLYIEAGCDVIASVDPMTSQISSRAFAQFVSPYATELFGHIRRCGAFSSFFVCGHAHKNVEVMCRCQPDNVSVDENIPLDFVKEVSQRYGLSFGGNLQLTVTLLMGSEDDVRLHTRETLELGGNVGYILAPGCDLPPGVPPANLRAVAEVVHESSSQKQDRTLLPQPRERSPEPAEDADEQTAKVVVEIITLDSEAWAPSHYTIETVREAAESFGELVTWRERRITDRDTGEFMLELMVKNVPIICLNGEITFVSTIPSRQKLIRAIQERLGLNQDT